MLSDCSLVEQCDTGVQSTGKYLSMLNITFVLKNCHRKTEDLFWIGGSLDYRFETLPNLSLNFSALSRFSLPCQRISIRSSRCHLDLHLNKGFLVVLFPCKFGFCRSVKRSDHQTRVCCVAELQLAGRVACDRLNSFLAKLLSSGRL